MYACFSSCLSSCSKQAFSVVISFHLCDHVNIAWGSLASLYQARVCCSAVITGGPVRIGFDVPPEPGLGKILCVLQPLVFALYQCSLARAPACIIGPCLCALPVLICVCLHFGLVLGGCLFLLCAPLSSASVLESAVHAMSSTAPPALSVLPCKDVTCQPGKSCPSVLRT